MMENFKEIDKNLNETADSLYKIFNDLSINDTNREKTVDLMAFSLSIFPK